MITAEWAAGFIEARGRLRIHRRRNKEDCFLYLGVRHIDRQVLGLLQEAWGGGITQQPARKKAVIYYCGTNRYSKPMQRDRQAKWNLYSRKVEICLRCILPYMKTKMKEHALLAIEFQNQKQPIGNSRAGIRRAYSKVQHGYHLRMEALQAVGP